MHLRFGTAILAATLLTAGMAFPAAAASDAWMATPADGDIVRDRVTLMVNVSARPVGELTLRLSQDGSVLASGTATIPLPCVDNCEEGAVSRWGNRTFDPVGGAPFSPTGVCNGEWMFQGKLDNGRWIELGKATFSAPAASITGLSGASREGFTEISWTKSKTPDVQGYRVERSTGAGWLTIASVDNATTLVEDDTVTSGRDYTYRVVTLRPDGLVGGQPAPPCSDKAPDLETKSKELVVRHGGAPSTNPSSEPTTSPSEPAGSGSGAGSGSSTGSSGSGSGSGSGTTPNGSGSSAGSGSGSNSPSGSGGSTSPAEGGDPANGNPDPDPAPGAGNDTGSGSTGSNQGSSRPARPVSAPPKPTRQTDNQITAPSLGGSAAAAESYYGEGEEFGEIDYGGAEPIAGESELVGYDEDGEPIYRVVAGGFEESSVQILDGSKLRVLAMGLLLVALAMHSRRWMNATT